jgi:hypothetical protein
MTEKNCNFQIRMGNNTYCRLAELRATDPHSIDYRFICDTEKCPMYQTWQLLKDK